MEFLILTWNGEETRKLQLGIELGFIEDRILINGTYARNRSSNQLLSYALPSITGASGVLLNFPATIQNINWEFSLNATIIKSESFNWNSTANLTIPENKLIDFSNLTTSTYTNTLIVGEPIGISKAFRFLGVDEATGDYTFADVDDKPTSFPNFLTDRTEIISTLPRFYGGIQNTFRYKGFQLDATFQFVKQIGTNAFFFNGYVSPGQFLGGVSNQPVTVLYRWQKPGDNASIQRYLATSFSNGYEFSSDLAYSDASYVRLKNLSLSWELPVQWIQNVHLQNCTIFFQGQNLATITKFKGLDPENPLSSGFSLPPLRMLTVGLNVKL